MQEVPLSPTTAAAPSRFPWTWALGVAVLAFAVRATVAVQLGKTALFQRPQLDSFEFLVWAQSIARGELFRWLAPTHGPGYPYFLGFLLSLLGGSVPAVRIAQAALGAGLCALTALLAARIFEDRRAGLAAGILLALYGPLVYVEVSLLAEGLFVLLLTLALWLLTRPNPTAGAAVAIGLLIGLAVIVRATALPLLPILVALILVRPARWSRRSAVWMALAWLAVVGPTLLLVRKTSGGWLPVQAYGGLNFYMGNRPGASGTPEARLGGDWDLLHAEPTRQGITIEADRERYYMKKAWTEIGQQPLAFVAGLGRKALWLVQDDEVRETHSVYFFREQSPLLRWLPGFGLLFPLAVWGLWLARRRLAAETVVYLAVFTASCILIIFSSRYRMPLVPLLAAMAGGAVVWLIDRARKQEWKALAPAAAVLAAAILVSHVRDHAPSHNTAEEWSMTAASLQALDRPDEAKLAVERALVEDPGSALAWVQAGRMRLDAADLPGAEKAFETAARLAPNYQRARFNLGVAYKRKGDLDAALRELRQSLWLAPGDPSSLTQIGEILLARGEVDEARKTWLQLVEKDPRNAPAWLALARIEGAARNPKAGVEMAKRAAEADPSQAETWMILAMLALDAGDAGTAENALDRAQGLLGPDAPAVGLGRAMLDRLRGNPEGADRRLKEILRRHPGFQQAAQLLVANAAQHGRRAEAEEFLRTLRPLTP